MNDDREIPERDAQQKWCPFAVEAYQMTASVYPPPNGSGIYQSPYSKTFIVPANRIYAGKTSNCLCLGKECMAWRGRQENGIEVGYCGMVFD